MPKKYQRKPNGFAEDLGAIIGLTNTLLLCGTRGGATLYIPENPTAGHLLETLLGASAFAAMVAEWPRETIKIPTLTDFGRYQRIRKCATLRLQGRSLHSIAAMTGVTYNQVKNDVRSAELIGLIPMVLHGEKNIISDEQIVAQLGFDGF